MINYIVYDPRTADVVITGYAPSSDDINSGSNFEYVVLPTSDLKLVDVPVLQDAIWARVKERKQAKVNQGIETPLGLVAGDLETQTVINRLVNESLRNKEFTSPFTFKTNISDKLDAKQILSLGSAYNTVLSKYHMIAQELRLKIYESEITIEALLKIDTISPWND